MTEKLTTTAMKKARKVKAPTLPKTAPKEPAPKTPPFTGPTKIVGAKNTVNGSHLVITGDDGSTFTLRSTLVTKEFSDIARTGMNYAKAAAMAKELSKPKTPGHLAKGLNSHNAPHSAKAIADNNDKNKPTTAATKKPAPKAPEKKAARAAKATPKADDARKITIVDKKFSYGAEGTSRRASWDACKASKTVAEYAAKGGALKYLPRWAAAGAIKLG